MSKLHLLWDIDGTLLTTQGVGHQPLMNAILAEFPQGKSLTLKECSGKTDYEIVKECVGPKFWTKKSSVENVITKYNNGLKQALHEKSACSIGQIDEILNLLNNNQRVDIAIVSGNNPEGAATKLKSAGIYKHFEGKLKFLSSYENHDRFAIARNAISTLGEGFSVFFGDTPSDILVANRLKVPVVAFSSGHHSYDELKIYNPTFVLNTPGLSEVMQTIDIFLNNFNYNSDAI